MEWFGKMLLVGGGAFIGGVLRYAISAWLQDRAGAFPLATLVINLIGSVAIGVYFAKEGNQLSGESARLFFAVGICGGFTTFSAFSWESLRLIQENRFGLAILYVLASVVLAIGGCAVGIFLGKQLFGSISQ